MPRDNGTPAGPDTTRALGRGLEDISHLFLSTTGETSARAPIDESMSEPSSGSSATRARVAVLRPGTALARDQLTAVLLEYRDALEEGMRTLAAAVSCGPYGEIDLLALDRFNRLTVVEVDTTQGDSLLLRGISHVDWVTRNLATVQRLYQSSWIDSVGQPRLFLVAPRFSRILTSAIRQLTAPQVVCFKYHTVASFGGAGLFIERLDDEDSS